jgi:hypothetical protein
MKVIASYGLTAGSLYKLLIIGLFIPIFILGLSLGIAGYFGYATVTFNDHQVFGFQAFMVSSMIGIFLPILLSAVLWCFIAFGVWVWTRVWKMNLTIKE